ncbi:hypothetical protein IP84_13710 [beta proteobacterium AAP99]|nr:hypothetical protein IP84_13710 [beta proteobacterium AAP99]
MSRTRSAALPWSAHPVLMRRLLLGAMLGTTLVITLSGCVAPVRERVVVREQVVAAAPVVRTMPAPIREDRGAPPAAGYGWVPGHWKWEGNGWAWVSGRWVAQAVPPMPAVFVEEITVAPSPRHYWVPGHWVWQINASNAGAWGWVRGSWRIG